MPLINILRKELDAEGNRIPDVVEESTLVKTEGRDENDEYIMEWVEYRFPNDDLIVHRSAHCTVKRWPQELTAIAQPLT